MCEIRKVYKYQGANPFVGINGRDFSDQAIQEEFCPTTQFWSRFNSQHEILIGTRGCGKTFLLKAMRLSMLKSINDDQAKEIIAQKKYIAFYIALQMERMANLSNVNRNTNDKITLFRFIFNSCLAISIISEAKKNCDDLMNHEIISNDHDLLTNKQQAILANTKLANKLYKVWFNRDTNESFVDLDDLAIEINNLYYNFNFYTDDISTIPSLFTSDLCSPLISANSILSEFWKVDEPTWILAIDEAEFVDELYQKTINSFMRSNPMHIILKIATLPYYWTTLETLNKDIEISAGNDFNYEVIDMDCDSDDFKRLTNKLCNNRMQRIRLSNSTINDCTLEDLLGKIGNDNRIDYFKNEMKGLTDEDIQHGILQNLSPDRKSGSATKKDLSQTIYKKYAPIYYVREIYKNKKGNLKPQWFAGSEVIRKVSQGNPRMFLNIMMLLFSYATSHKNFGTKEQHQVVVKYAHNVCEATKAIEKDGKDIYKNLSLIAKQLHDKTHDGYLKEIGCSFTFRKNIKPENQSWIKRAISFSRVLVDETSIKSGITSKTKYSLCNVFAVEYWLTMRNDYPTIVSLIESKELNRSDFPTHNQLSFL